MATIPTVADLLVDGLRHAGVSWLFTAGDAGDRRLLAAARERGVPIVVGGSELAAGLMAAVTGELTAVPGVAVVGAEGTPASAAAAVEYARANRAPMILITERATPFGALVKQSLAVEPASASHRVGHAVQLALKEPRGPVHLNLTAQAAFSTALPVVVNVVPPEWPAPDPGALEAAADLIRRADRPLIIVGLGCRTRQDSEWLRAFAEALPAPVLTTPKTKGVMPEPHPLSLGVFTNGAVEEAFVRRADLVVGVGLDPVELEARPWPYTVPVVHLARVLHAGECFHPSAEVVGEPGLILEELALRLRGKGRADWDVSELDRVKRERWERLAVAATGLTGERAGAAGEVSERTATRWSSRPAVRRGLTSRRIIEIARELSPAGTVVVTDPGPHALAVTWFWPAVAPGEFVTASAASAPPGFALPAAIAAQLASPERRVVCFTGMTGLVGAVAELRTAVRLGLPIAVLCFADPESDRDLGALAHGFGLLTVEAGDEASARLALSAALTGDRAVLIAVYATGTAR